MEAARGLPVARTTPVAALSKGRPRAGPCRIGMRDLRCWRPHDPQPKKLKVALTDKSRALLPQILRSLNRCDPGSLRKLKKEDAILQLKVGVGCSSKAFLPLLDLPRPRESARRHCGWQGPPSNINGSLSAIATPCGSGIFGRCLKIVWPRHAAGACRGGVRAGDARRVRARPPASWRHHVRGD